jgi:hypothetical protein
MLIPYGHTSLADRRVFEETLSLDSRGSSDFQIVDVHEMDAALISRSIAWLTARYRDAA